MPSLFPLPVAPGTGMFGSVAILNVLHAAKQPEGGPCLDLQLLCALQPLSFLPRTAPDSSAHSTVCDGFFVWSNKEGCYRENASASVSRDICFLEETPVKPFKLLLLSPRAPWIQRPLRFPYCLPPWLGDSPSFSAASGKGSPAPALSGAQGQLVVLLCWWLSPARGRGRE